MDEGGTVGSKEEELRAQLEELRRELEQERERCRQLADASSRASLPGAASGRVQLDAIIRHLPVALMIVEAPSGRLLSYNAAAEELFGGPPPAVETVAEYSELYHGFHPDGRPLRPTEWPLARAILHGEHVAGEEVEFDRLDGGRVCLRVSAAPIRDEGGRVVAAVAGIFDVTAARRQAEVQSFLVAVSEALSASLDYEETVQRVAELCVRGLADFAAVYALGDDGEPHGLGFAVADPEDRKSLELLRTGVPRDAGADHPVLEVVRTGAPVLHPTLSERLLRQLAGGEERVERMRALEVASTLVVPLQAGGRTLGAVALARRAATPPFGADDLELASVVASRAAHAVDNARLYLDAQRTARTQEETISVVSHDLRNALNAALTNADLLLDITPAFEAASRPRRQMEAMRRSLDHMHRLVQDLLELDRLDRRRFSIHLDLLPLTVLVEEVHGLLGPLARDAGLHSEVIAPREEILLRADYARMVQVLSNLIGNAVKATPPGGRITVRVEVEPDEIHFHVTDTGAGIDSEHLPRIFERFFQVPSRGKAGSGLGLTISRGIVEAHGGRIWADSRPGEGSTFSFSVPRHAPGS